MLRFCKKAVEAGIHGLEEYGTVDLWITISGGKQQRLLTILNI